MDHRPNCKSKGYNTSIALEGKYREESSWVWVGKDFLAKTQKSQAIKENIRLISVIFKMQ